MININKGKQTRALRVCVYSIEGLGKTTFASKFPEPLFIDTEDGTFNMDVARVDKPQTWQELMNIIKEVREQKLCKTLVIDTLDWAEQLAIKEVTEKHRVNSLESINYGKGYVFVADCFTALLEELNRLIDSGIHVVLTAHAKPRKFELPEEMGQYDRYEMKLTRQVSPLIKEWCDMLLFFNYKTFVVVTESGTKKAQGGKRVMYTTHNPCWDAKNRFDLPEELDLSFDGIKHLFVPLKKDSEEKVANKSRVSEEIVPNKPVERSTICKIKRLIEEANITENDLKTLISAKGHYSKETSIEDYSDDFITRWIIPNWKKITETIKNGGKE